MTLAVDVDELSHRFGSQPVLRKLSLQIEPGERLAIFGANGAGKSTLLRILAALTRPISGDVRVFGSDPWRNLNAHRRRIGFVGHRPYLDEHLTAAENLKYYTSLYNAPVYNAGALLELVGLGHRRDSRVGDLSRGMQQRLSLARALIHDPDLLLLDEPDTGLDQPGFEALAAALAQRPRTVVMTSHHPERARTLVSRALLLESGRLVCCP